MFITIVLFPNIFYFLFGILSVCTLSNKSAQLDPQLSLGF